MSLDAEEAPDRETRPGGAEQETGAEQAERVQREGQRVYVGAGVDVAENPRQRELLAQHEQDNGGYGAREAAEETLEHERPAHEPIGRADELHHLDLTP